MGQQLRLTSKTTQNSHKFKSIITERMTPQLNQELPNPIHSTFNANFYQLQI